MIFPLAESCAEWMQSQKIDLNYSTSETKCHCELAAPVIRIPLSSAMLLDSTELSPQDVEEIRENL